MKKSLISILILIFIVSLSISVYAAEGSINVGASSDTVVKGKTFTVTISGISDTNIIGMKADMAYDEAKLELVSRKAGDNFTDGSANNSEIAIATGGVGDKSVTLAVYTFKVKDTAAEGTADIKISNIILAADTDIKITEDKVVTITIKEDDTTAGGGSNQEEGTPSNGDNGNGGTDGSNGNGGTEDKKENVATNKNTNSNKTANTSKNTNKNKTTTKLPQTGAENTILFAIVTLGAVSIVSYISYKKYNNI